MFIDAIAKVKISEGFWSRKLNHVIDNTLPYQWKALNDEVEGVSKSGAVENFKRVAGILEKGDFHGFVFQDSDLYKWLEAVAYSLMVRPDSELEKVADDMIDLIGKAQWDDGYINTHFSLKYPEKRWTNIRDQHEMYCAGHMFEAAVAYFVATGKPKFLEISKKFADHIDSIIGDGEGKMRAYPGHEEIELALVKLYRVTDEKRYLDLAKFFIDERGQEPHYFAEEAKKRGDEIPEYMRRREGNPNAYNQSHKPVRDQDVATGHAVRAMYLYSGITEVANYSGDESLKETVRRLFDNVTKKQMYITGGIGAQGHGEAFSFDYDLPNDETYSETCAQIGLFLWAHRMFEMDKNPYYANIMERVLYNGIICGVSLDGKKYFYTNPLEIVPEVAKQRHDKRYALERQGWFTCACCPPNLARMMLSLGSFIYTVDKDDVYLNLFIGSEAKLTVNGTNVEILQKSTYELDGRAELKVKTEKSSNLNLHIRVPYWTETFECVNDKNLSVVVKNGYATVSGEFSGETVINISAPVKVVAIAADPRVREDTGNIAIMRGPFVYCLEEIDNGKDLSALSIDLTKGFIDEFEPSLLEGVTVVKASGYRDKAFDSGELYKPYCGCKTEVTITAVPYYAWNNRGIGEMKVWIRK